MQKNVIMTVADIRGGYSFSFFKRGIHFLHLDVTFEDDNPVANITDKSPMITDAEIELYRNWAFRTAKMMEE